MWLSVHAKVSEGYALKFIRLALISKYGGNTIAAWGAVIAQWIHAHLPFAVPGSNPKHTIHTFSLYSETLYYICDCVENRSKIKKKLPGLVHFKKEDCSLRSI